MSSPRQSRLYRRVIGICNEHVKWMKPANFLEFLWYRKYAEAQPTTAIPFFFFSFFSFFHRYVRVNLERFHYLHKHFSVGFFLMNINGESLERLIFFSLSLSPSPCLFLFTYFLTVDSSSISQQTDLRPRHFWKFVERWIYLWRKEYQRELIS